MFVDFNAFRGDLKEVVANPERDLLAGRVEAGWRLRVTRATSSTGVKGGLQDEEWRNAKYLLPSRGSRARGADTAISWASEW